MVEVKAFQVQVTKKEGGGYNKKPKVPKGKSWRDYSESITSSFDISSPNIGVIVPEGVVIIDLDTYKGITTKDVDKVLGCALNWEEALLQTTPSGGQHYAFTTAVNIRQGSDLLDLEGFDTRVTNKGWIASGKGYTDETAFGVVETLHELLLPSLPIKAEQKLKEQVDTSENDDFLQLIEDESIDITFDQAKTFLDLLPDNCASGDKWLTVAQAVRHQFKGSDEQDELGWQLFDEFSKRQPDEYDEQQNRNRYFSFEKNKTGNKTTFATVIQWAGGWDAYNENTTTTLLSDVENTSTVDELDEMLIKAVAIKSSLKLDQFVKQLQDKYEELKGHKPSLTALKREIKKLKTEQVNAKRDQDYIDNYIYIEKNNSFLNRITRSEICPRAFDMKFSRITPLTVEGEKQRATNYAENLIETAHDTMYLPDYPDLFAHEDEQYYNTYRAHEFQTVTTSNIVERIEDHIKFLLSDEKEREIFTYYLAHNVQKPGKKIQWSIVLQGIQGDGKSLFAEMMQRVLGYRNVRMLDASELASSFTGYAVGQCMTFIEEVMIDSHDKYTVLNKLKPYITNEVVSVTAKGKDPKTCPNTTNYMMFTNYKNAIPIDANDRRYCILFSEYQQPELLEAFERENPNYFHSLYESMRKNVSELYDWLNNMTIPEWFYMTKRAPITRAKFRMIENSKPAAQIALELALDKFQDFDINENVINVTKLTKLVNNEYDDTDEFSQYPNQRQINPMLLAMGYNKIGRTKTQADGNKCTIYAKSDSTDANKIYDEAISKDLNF